MMEPAYTLSEKQLRDFLAQLVEEGKLDFDGSGCLGSSFAMDGWVSTGFYRFLTQNIDVEMF